jgi:hypothetical protein
VTGRRYVRGADIRVGQVLAMLGDRPLVIAEFTEYDPPVGGPGRIARDAQGVGMVVFDTQPTAVLS